MQLRKKLIELALLYALALLVLVVGRALLQ